MIRFIDLRGQDTGYRFAFFSTITDTFMNIGGFEVFDTWQDFKDACDPEDLRLYYILCPKWLKEE